MLWEVVVWFMGVWFTISMAKDDSFRSNRISVLYAVLGIFILSMTSFSPSLKGDFVFDDTEAIVNNGDVTTSPIINLLQNDFWGRPLNSTSSHKSYRPLTVLSFRLNYYWYGALEPFRFHLVNITLHIIVCVTLLFTYTVILERFINWRTIPLQAYYASLLFAVHPVHTENVAGIVGRADVLSALFFFLAFLLFARKLSVLTIAKDGQSHTFLMLTVAFTVFSALVFASFLCKEQGIMVLPFCCTYNFVIMLALRCRNVKKLQRKWQWFILSTSILALETLGLLLFRFWVMNWQVPHFQESDNPSSFLPSWIQRVANYNYLYCINSWLLLCPLWLCFDWSMGCISLIRDIWDVRLVAVLILWLSLVGLLVRTVREIKFDFSSSLSVALAIVVLPFLPASNNFLRVGFVIAERVLYISSAGFCLIIALGLQRLKSFSKRPQILSAVYVLLLLLFSFRSYRRSHEWCKEKELYLSGLDVCPLNAKVYYNIAKSFADSGNKTFAMEMYEEALRLNPKYDQAMNNLANILRELGETDKAKSLLTHAVTLRSDFAAAWMNLGIVEALLRNFTGAEHCYLTALSHRQHYPDCYYNLGNMYLDQKEYNKAFEAWKTAVRLKPTLAVAWNNMVLLLDNIDQLDRAKQVATEALRMVPDDASIHFNYANVLGKLSQFAESEKHFHKAIQKNSKNPSFFINLGVLYHRWKRYSKAEIAYSRALELDPENRGARDNLALLQRTIAKSKQPLD